ncbi:hypothetical protein SAMN02745218_02481 [Desulfofundulus australicus DSM 11792]|uniref:Uncharacterized protein n=1 Tax=Desulfofundulus australicus DSM 11792 TaxID=1121425 RepID=A0A1M5CCA4_9FIRM|nr:hypothetical protein [Desulfofundulus australicus]SHF52227.1 hypothetical protein SAMN02745218_02481 [Desulfofundulus australicus DSM 11792]
MQIIVNGTIEQELVDRLIAEEKETFARQRKSIAKIVLTDCGDEIEVKTYEESPIRRIRRITGYLAETSHLVLDSFNPQGVWWTWPFGRRWSLREVLPWPFTFETGSRVETWFLRPALWLGTVLLIARCLGVVPR